MNETVSDPAVLRPNSASDLAGNDVCRCHDESTVDQLIVAANDAIACVSNLIAGT